MSEIAADQTHDWHFRFGCTCCRRCGYVRRADRQNKPCKGTVRIAFRTEPVDAQASIDRVDAELARIFAASSTVGETM